MNAACASARHHGPRAPANHGSTTTPPAPGATVAAAASSSSSWVRPVIDASQATAAPAAESPASTTKPPSAPRDTAATAGSAATGPGCGTETFAVVPHDTIGARADAPAPEHLARAIARARDHAHVGAKPERARRVGGERSDDRGGRDDRRQPLAVGRERAVEPTVTERAQARA